MKAAHSPKFSGDLAAGVPNEELNHLRGFFNVVLYGMRTWGIFFSPRQKLSLATFWFILRDELPAALADTHPKEEALAIRLALACSLGRATNAWSAVARWDAARENVQGTFARQALPMVWDYVEANPFSTSTGNYLGAVDWVADVCEAIGDAHLMPGRAVQASATQHPLPDDSADLVFTDPPYYDAVPYADLSDYFYTWFRRGLAQALPDFFVESVTPKQQECVMLSHRAAM